MNRSLGPSLSSRPACFSLLIGKGATPTEECLEFLPGLMVEEQVLHRDGFEWKGCLENFFQDYRVFNRHSQIETED